MLFREEGFKLWDNFVSDKIVYFAQPVSGDLKIRDGIRGVNWWSKWNVGHFYLQLKFVFFGKRDAYQGAVLKVRSGCHDDVSFKAKGNAPNSDLLMLVDIAKAIQLPKGMFLTPRPVRIWLKRFDDLEGGGRDVRNFSGVTLVTGQGAFRLDRETCLPSRFVGSDESQLPCEVIESRTKGVGELSEEHRDIVRGDLLFDPNVIERILKIVIWRDGISIVPKFDDSNLEFVEAYVRPAELHLCMNKPNS